MARENGGVYGNDRRAATWFCALALALAFAFAFALALALARGGRGA